MSDALDPPDQPRNQPPGEPRDNGENEHIAESWRCYLSERCEDGVRLARSALRIDSSRGDAWYVLACNLERLRSTLEADRAFQRAARAQINPQPAPFRVSLDKFTRTVHAAADDLPGFLRRALGEVDLVLRNYPLPALIDANETEEPLGFHLGPTRQATQPGEDHVAAIQLYRRCHEHRSSSAAHFRQLVDRNLFDQLAAYLGLNESERERMRPH